MAIGGKIGSGAARPFKGKVPSVAFGNHIIGVLGLAAHCGHWWENRLRPLWPLVEKIGSGAGALWPLVGKSAEATVAIGEKNRLRRGEAF